MTLCIGHPGGCQEDFFPALKFEADMQDRTVPFWTKLYNDEEYTSTNRTYEHAFYIPSKYQVYIQTYSSSSVVCSIDTDHPLNPPRSRMWP